MNLSNILILEGDERRRAVISRDSSNRATEQQDNKAAEQRNGKKQDNKIRERAGKCLKCYGDSNIMKLRRTQKTFSGKEGKCLWKMNKTQEW